MLDLINPVRPRWRHFGRRRQARFDKANKLALTLTQQNHVEHIASNARDTNVSRSWLNVAGWNFWRRPLLRNRRFPVSRARTPLHVPGLGLATAGRFSLTREPAVSLLPHAQLRRQRVKAESGGNAPDPSSPRLRNAVFGTQQFVLVDICLNELPRTGRLSVFLGAW